MRIVDAYKSAAAVAHHHLNLPSAFSQITEPPLATLDWMAEKNPLLRRMRKSAPQGDGSAALIVPGYFGTKESVSSLHKSLRNQNYRTYDWKKGQNLGRKFISIQELEERFLEIYNKNGEEKTTLCGHSLGGLYCMLLAARHPEKIRGIITLDTPFNTDFLADPDNPVALSIVKLLQKEGETFGETKAWIIKTLAELKELQKPHEFYMTHIYNRNKGIIGSTAGFDPVESFMTENIEVYGSHIGMGMNVAVHYAVLDRMAQPEGEFSPFDIRKRPHAIMYPQYPYHQKFMRPAVEGADYKLITAAPELAEVA